MFVTDINDVKIYNLSAGKSLPDWLADRKRREVLKKNVDLRKRIELIQDFDMPDECQTIRMSPDKQFIIATGTYKPRVKCYETNNLSQKFERCFDSEVIACEILSEDYSKMVFLQTDRFIEFHVAHGRHYRLRIPRCGYDMVYHLPTSDLILVGDSSEIYRFNLERGQFLQPYQSNSNSSINSCTVNPEHHLICVGTQEGTIEAWDSRERKRCATLDVAIKIPTNLSQTFPSITSIQFKNGLQMGVGTKSGHVLIYDIRAKEPLLIKDHLNKLPIHKIHFNQSHNVVYSLDDAMLKIWDENNGKQIAYIESEYNFNDFCTIPNTGMLFMAQQNTKMLTYYIPSLGPAPKWCSFLDNLTEEIEMENVQNIYDDYKFLTRKELEELGLDHLEGSNLLRAYMHGYFIDIRLYNKARSVIEPFAFDNYRKDKIRQQIEATRPERLKIKNNLPKVNQELALKCINNNDTKKRQKTNNLLEDDRFKIMFEDPAYEIDKNADEYKMLTPVLARLDKSKVKELRKKVMAQQMEIDHEDQIINSDDEDLFYAKDSSESSSDDNDDGELAKEMKKQYKQIKKDKFRRERENKNENDDDDDDDDDDHEEHNKDQDNKKRNEPKVIEFSDGNFMVKNMRQKINKSSLGDRITQLQNDTNDSISVNNLGNRQMSFSIKSKEKDVKKREYQLKKHREERKLVIRPTTSLRLKRYIPK